MGLKGVKCRYIISYKRLEHWDPGTQSPVDAEREDICDISKNFSLKLDSKNDFIHFYNPYTFLLVCEIFLERMEALGLWEVT